MKTKNWIILLSVLLLLSIGLSIPLLLPGRDSLYAEIRSQGVLLKYVDLQIDQEFTVDGKDGGRNVVTVKNGKIAVTEANCPDHYCMHRGFCSSGTPIVCLPNQLVISFEGPQEVDGIVG